MKYKFTDLIDIDEIQRLLNSFCDVVGISAGIIDLDGNVTIGSRLQEICTGFHRVNEQTLKKCIKSDTQLANELQKGERFSVYRCQNGLTDAVSPIIIEKKHVANAYVGQFLLEPPDIDFFRNQAVKYSFEEKPYLRALSQVPIVTEERLPSILNFLTTFSEVVAKMGLERLKLLETEEELKEFYDIVNKSPAVVFLWENDEGWPVEFVSDNVKTLFGYTVEEFISGKVVYSKTIHPDDLGRVAQEVNTYSCETERKTFTHEPYRIVTKDGNIKWVDDKTYIRRDENGNITHYQGIVEDITEHKLAVEALHESEEYINAIINRIADPICVKDSEHRWILVNDKFCEIAGAERKSLLGKSDYDFFPEEEADVFWKMDELVLRDGKENFSEESLTNATTGDAVLLNTKKTLYENKRGQKFIVAIGRDITDFRKLQDQIQRAQKMEALATLAGGVAHDLNNVLGGIVSYPDLLLMDLSEESPLRKPIETIKNSGEKASVIVQDLLTLARRSISIMEPVNLNEIVTAYLSSPEHAQIIYHHPGVQINTDLEKNLLYCMGSSVHLSKMIMNLINNAAEAMPDGGDILIKSRNRYIDRPIKGFDEVQENDYTVLEISDHGVGIPKEDMEKIFEPFYTKKKMGRSGTGLGMAVVWGTVKDHQGYIEVNSTPDSAARLNNNGRTIEWASMKL